MNVNVVSEGAGNDNFFKITAFDTVIFREQAAARVNGSFCELDSADVLLCDNDVFAFRMLTGSYNLAMSPSRNIMAMASTMPEPQKP